MARKSYARDALRSFLPESYLLQRRDVDGLEVKYRSRLLGLWGGCGEILASPSYWKPYETDFTPKYCEQKYFGGLRVEADQCSPIRAVDTKRPGYIRYGRKDATFLHLDEWKGLHSLRYQLTAAAEYVGANRNLRHTPYVAGITYRELGSLMVRLGFGEMEIQQIDEERVYDVRAVHSAYCAINGRKAEFKLTAVVLPTKEFIGTFGPPCGQSVLG